MTEDLTPPPRRSRSSIVATILLLVAGFIAGIAADRLYTLHRGMIATETSLTTDDLMRTLHLPPADEARVRALVDSIQIEVTRASESGTDSLPAIARRAHARIEAAPPPESRAAFREWVARHHHAMTMRFHHR